MDKGKDKDRDKKIGLGDELSGTRLGEYRDGSATPKEDKGTTAAKRQGGDLFIVDNSDSDWKVKRYLQEWADIAHTFDIATGYFEIGALLALDGEWQKLERLRGF